MTSSIAPRVPALALSRATPLVISAAIAAALGVLTAYAQDWLPEELGSLANSAGSWVAITFTLAWCAANRATAAATGALTLLALLSGYTLGADTRGLASSTTTTTIWALVALTVGPPVGTCAHWLRHRHPTLAPVGAGAVAGLLVGEGIYGLTVIDDTTYPPYWTAHLLAGVAFLAVALINRARSLRAFWIASLTAAIVAGGFVIGYNQPFNLLL